MLFAVARLAFFAAGVLTALELQRWSPFLRIRFPWVSVFQLEFGALSVIIAGRLLLHLRRAGTAFLSKRTAPLPLLVAFLLGFGAPMLLAGTIGLSAYVLIGP